ncbi:cysteine desulfurase family protein [Cellulosilyticum sp. I15G10I2]|uniref:cysteine desulfurase family protein n=1 Tax=Cellulosilyticum sp. I15G10I2 TaxID=1892843 RepID=UPI00085C2834|nr:cysteine desulfurase family protein [Cellulosilyticum sp. I15G10I2]
MIYLDYAATTPVNKEVLQTFCDISTRYMANPNASHQLGLEAKARLDLSTENIAELLGIKTTEIIYTSGASEANNLAVKGIANQYKKYGKHIITTYLEHSSVTGAIKALQNIGYEVDFVDVLENGLVDLEHLKELLRSDTILVSVCYVDSEMGIKQHIDEIGNLLEAYPHCFFHVDATQAIGKIPVSLNTIDLMTFAPHKFYGLNGCGILIKKEQVIIEPLIHGGKSTTQFRSGTPMLALAAATEHALKLALLNQQTSYAYVEELNQKLKVGLSAFAKVKINSTKECIPFILNVSIPGIKAEIFQKALEKHAIYISTKSACCPVNTASKAVYAVTKDKKLALATLRISLSQLTTPEECEIFLQGFSECYKNLVK